MKIVRRSLTRMVLEDFIVFPAIVLAIVLSLIYVLTGWIP